MRFAALWKLLLVGVALGPACTSARADYLGSVLTTNPVMYYAFGEADSTLPAADAAGEAQDGAYYNNPVLGVHAGPRPSDGFANMPAENMGMFTTNSNAYGVMGVFTNVIPMEPFAYSMSAWVKPLASSWSDAPVFDFMGRCDSGSYLGEQIGFMGNAMGDDAGKLFYHRNTDDWVAIASGSALDLNEWYNVTMTRDGEDLEVYLNGDPTPVISTTVAYPTGNDGGLFIFGRHIGFSAPLEGITDEGVVWDRALSPEEVHDIYQYATVPEPGALALLATGLIGLLCHAWRKWK